MVYWKTLHISLSGFCTSEHIFRYVYSFQSSLICVFWYLQVINWTKYYNKDYLPKFQISNSVQLNISSVFPISLPPISQFLFCVLVASAFLVTHSMLQISSIVYTGLYSRVFWMTRISSESSQPWWWFLGQEYWILVLQEGYSSFSSKTYNLSRLCYVTW